MHIWAASRPCRPTPTCPAWGRDGPEASDRRAARPALKVICVRTYPVAIPVRRRTSDNGPVKTALRGVGSRAPLTGLAAAVLALLLIPSLVLGAEWTDLRRVSSIGDSRLDSLHQLAADRDKLHLVHPRIGPNTTDDRIVYQRSLDGGISWTRERTLFSATLQRRDVVPNLAIAAQGNLVVVAWRVDGPTGSALFVRASRDGGVSFGPRDVVFTTSRRSGVGVPAVAVGGGVVAVAWTSRASGRVKVRISRDAGRTFEPAETLGRTALSIDCRKRVTDGLVGLAINDRSIHVAWSHAPKRACLASALRVRTSLDRGKRWSPERTITEQRSYGWPELDSRGKTVIATVQSPTGGIIIARSDRNGRNWQDRLMKPNDGHSYSAADVVLLPKRKAMITFVDERVRKRRLVSTTVVSKRSPDDGRTWKGTKAVAPSASLLRMAPNIVALGARPTIVLQSGQLDGSPRNLYSTRLR